MVDHASRVDQDPCVLANAGLVRGFSVVRGNSLVGTVVNTEDPAYRIGARVVQTGWDLGLHAGGHGRHACVKSDWGVGNFYADDPLPLST